MKGWTVWKKSLQSMSLSLMEGCTKVKSIVGKAPRSDRDAHCDDVSSAAGGSKMLLKSSI
jgi:hypothetical protein